MDISPTPILEPTGVLVAAEDTAQLRQDSAQPLEAPAPSLVYKPQTETWDTAKAVWNRITFANQVALAAAAVSGIGPLEGEALDGNDPTYNPYAYAVQHKGEYADIWDNVLAGHFDEVRSETGFRRRSVSDGVSS